MTTRVSDQTHDTSPDAGWKDRACALLRVLSIQCRRVLGQYEKSPPIDSDADTDDGILTGTTASRLSWEK